MMIALSPALAAFAGRTTLPFNNAWRFLYGDDPSSPPGAGPGTCAFEEDLGGVGFGRSGHVQWKSRPGAHFLVSTPKLREAPSE